MFWSEDLDAVLEMPVISPAKTTKRLFFQDGNPRMGRDATVWGPDIANTIVCELLNLVEGAGLAPDKQDLFQVLKAVRQIVAASFGSGIAAWSETADYTLPALVWGGNYRLYVARLPSGPQTNHPLVAGAKVGPKDPTTTAGADYWYDLLNFLHEGDGAGSGAVVSASTLIYPGAFYDFYEHQPPAGWMARHGALIPNADVAVPLLWEALHLAKNRDKLKTESQWQAMSETNPWFGIGGVPFFVLDDFAKSIRLPDTRGMYREDSGFDGLVVGGVHGDAIRNITGTVGTCTDTWAGGGVTSGAFYTTGSAGTFDFGFSYYSYKSNFDASRVVPTASVNRPKAFGMLGCVYVGPPAN